jgi:hypothetical protein
MQIYIFYAVIIIAMLRCIIEPLKILLDEPIKDKNNIPDKLSAISPFLTIAILILLSWPYTSTIPEAKDAALISYIIFVPLIIESIIYRIMNKDHKYTYTVYWFARSLVKTVLLTFGFIVSAFAVYSYANGPKNETAYHIFITMFAISMALWLFSLIRSASKLTKKDNQDHIFIFGTITAFIWIPISFLGLINLSYILIGFILWFVNLALTGAMGDRRSSWPSPENKQASYLNHLAWSILRIFTKNKTYSQIIN